MALLVVVAPTMAQEKKPADRAKAQYEKMINAMNDGKYKVFLSFTHPNAVKKLGGEEKALKALKKTMKALKDRGFTFKLVSVDTPKIVKGKKKKFAVGTYTALVTVFGKKIRQKSMYIGESNDKGQTWKFVRVDRGGEATVRKLLPDLPKNVKITKPEQKVEDDS